MIKPVSRRRPLRSPARTTSRTTSRSHQQISDGGRTQGFHTLVHQKEIHTCPAKRPQSSEFTPRCPARIMPLTRWFDPDFLPAIFPRCSPKISAPGKSALPKPPKRRKELSREQAPGGCLPGGSGCSL